LQIRCNVKGKKINEGTLKAGVLAGKKLKKKKKKFIISRFSSTAEI